MQMLTPDAVKLLESAYNVVRVWMPILGLLWGGFKVIQWTKDIRTKDLPELKNDISKLHTEMGNVSNELKTQTTSVVNELRELRNDMRTYYVPQKAFARAKKAKN